MIEDERTEFKEEVNESIAKAAVAFSNTEGGQILVGVNDDGDVVGVDDTDQTAITCAQLLRDRVRPDIAMTSKIRIVDFEGKNVIRIDVAEGPFKPYFLRDKGLRAEGVYTRRGTSNQPVSETEFLLMTQAVRSRNFEMTTSLEQNLTFNSATYAFSQMGLPFDQNHMKILGVTSDDGYTNLGWILSDQFDVGVKVAVYPDEFKSSFTAREEFYGSAISQYNDALRFIKGNTVRSSVIKGSIREDFEEYPYDALREVLLNAIIHRDYSISGTILVSMFPDRLTISSPGGLNEAYSMSDLALGVSSSRNPKLANVFYRLGLVETYGSGIPRVLNSYIGYGKPEFISGQSVFFVSLPSRLSERDFVLESFLKDHDSFTRTDLEDAGYSRNIAIRLIRDLEASGRIEKVGGGRSVRYIRTR